MTSASQNHLEGVVKEEYLHLNLVKSGSKQTLETSKAGNF
jgi:hypothetical protein